MSARRETSRNCLPSWPDVVESVRRCRGRSYAWKSTGCRVGHEKMANIFLRTLVEEVAAQRRAGVLPEQPLTVARYAESSIAKRKRLGKLIQRA